jgi:hypothetical protein
MEIQMLWAIFLYITTPQMEKPEVRKIDGYFYSEQKCWEVVGHAMDKIGETPPGVMIVPRCMPIEGKEA